MNQLVAPKDIASEQVTDNDIVPLAKAMKLLIKENGKIPADIQEP